MDEFVKKLISRLKEEADNANDSILLQDDVNDASYFDGMEDGLDMAIEIVNQLAEEYNNGWIPCSERLPEDIVKDCLVTLENGAVFQASYSGIGKEFRMICWHGIERFSEENKVIAWQPLPEAYKPTTEQPDSISEAWKRRTMSRFERVE